VRFGAASSNLSITTVVREARAEPPATRSEESLDPIQIDSGTTQRPLGYLGDFGTTIPTT